MGFIQSLFTPIGLDMFLYVFILTIAFIAIGALIVFVIWLIHDYYHVPFRFPRIVYEIDLSGRRQPSYEECIEEWLIKFNGHGSAVMYEYYNTLDIWEKSCHDYLRRNKFWKKRKLELYTSIRRKVYADNYKIIKFVFYRNQTRYSQVHYKKTSYQVNNIVHVMNVPLYYIMEIDDVLEEIDYETTRAKYFAKNQRRLMTKELRRKIIIRDNYTCQICGKYMPDEVGLHVDHIIPIKRGGKSVESNLQVLCDKCNLSKGKK